MKKEKGWAVFKFFIINVFRVRWGARCPVDICPAPTGSEIEPLGSMMLPHRYKKGAVKKVP